MGFGHLTGFSLVLSSLLIFTSAGPEVRICAPDICFLLRRRSVTVARNVV